jgi:hypothetical protein
MNDYSNKVLAVTDDIISRKLVRIIEKDRALSDGFACLSRLDGF